MDRFKHQNLERRAGHEAAKVSSEPADGETAIRTRLRQWLEANHRRDRAGMLTVWDPAAICWAPAIRALSNEAASSMASSNQAAAGWSTYELTIEAVDVAGDIGVVHDIWLETRHFPDTPTTVSRRLRGSELWRHRSDGAWRITRCVSAPDDWRIDSPASGGGAAPR